MNPMLNAGLKTPDPGGAVGQGGTMSPGQWPRPAGSLARIAQGAERIAGGAAGALAGNGAN
jgi:hypothetical protein